MANAEHEGYEGRGKAGEMTFSSFVELQALK
jgi:hypothetical protein